MEAAEGVAAVAQAKAAARSLDAYVPRLVVDWIAGDPQASTRWRAVDGTLVFADVSGFTPLSERLARKGRRGAEELTDVLNHVFGELLGIAGGHGGDLLKFGGDALLLLFTGDDHPRRAAVAAAEMQVALRTVGRIDTGSGEVRLRMSVGVHSGELLLFLVGATHRELLITGPGATETVRMEAAADAGEVLLSGPCTERLPSAWVGEAKEGGRLLRLNRASGSHPPDPQVSSTSPSSTEGVPACLRDHLQTAPPDGEHRQATLAFLQFKGLEVYLEAKGPDTVASALDDLLVACQSASARHDVTLLATDVDADGGKVLFAAGAPHARDNDDDRMLQALREVLDTPLALAVRAGVNRGSAFAVDVGSDDRRTYAVMGDPTNLAARVMGKAPMGGLVATEAVVERLRTDFELRRMEPFVVKGKSQPISAFEVGAVRGGRRTAVVSDRPLLGRQREIDRLDEAVAALTAGRGSRLAFVGEAGLGKSRLVERLLSVTADRPQLVVEGGQYAIHNPYFALRAPLRAWLGTSLDDPAEVVAERLQAETAAHAPHLGPWLALANPVLGIELVESAEVARLDPTFRRRRMGEVLHELLTASMAPAVLVVEDAHWLDDASADLLRPWIAAERADPWLVCLTRRDVAGGLDVGDDAGVDVHRLDPLSPEAARELLYQGAGDRPLSPSIVDALADRSAGNPLFLQELLAAAAETGTADDLPDRVEPLIAARIDRLAADDRRLLLTASVLGARFTGDHLGALLDEDVGRVGVRLGALDRFLESDPRGELRFRHALIREVSYNTLPFRRRRELHARAGAVLEAEPERPLALLSLHWFHAQEFAKAWATAIEAAEEAVRASAPVEATALYRRAVESARALRSVPAPDLARTYLALGTQAEIAGRYDEARAALREARLLSRDRPADAVSVMLKDGWVCERSKRYSAALRWYSRALRTLDDADPDDPHVVRLRGETLKAYGAARLRQGRFKEGIPWVEQAIEHLQRVDDRAGLAHAYYLMDWGLTDAGDAQGAEPWRARALPIYEELGDLAGQANVLNNLGVDAYYEGRWDDALDLYERSRIARAQVGDVVQMGTAANNIAEILSDQGRLDEAAVLFEEARRVWRGTNFPVGHGLAVSNLGRVAARAGRFEEADARYDEATRLFEEIGAGAFLLETEARRAERHVLAGEPAPALELADRVCSQYQRTGGATPVIAALAHRCAGAALAQQGDLAGARRRFDESLTIARAASADYEVALTLEARHRLAGAPDGDGVRAAEAIFERLGVVSTPDVPTSVCRGDQPLVREPGAPPRRSRRRRRRR
jgi:class 3 adenylate cyclase/tetratricopeptide (TPR) repeat protein